MSKRDKLLLKLLSGNSDANFDIEDLVKILYGCNLKKGKRKVAIEYIQ